MRTGRKKTVFIMAALIVLAVGVALVGNTLATSINRESGEETELSIDDGTYNVDVFYRDAKGNYVSLSENDGASFAKDMFWCPGRTEIAYLRIMNNEKFVVECAPLLSVSIDDTTTQAAKLGDVLEFAVIDGLKSPADLKEYSNWAAFKNSANSANSDAVKGGSGKLEVGTYEAFDKVNGKTMMYPLSSQGGEAYFALAIHMDENASNDYQKAELNLKINLKVDANHKPGADPQ